MSRIEQVIIGIPGPVGPAGSGTTPADGSVTAAKLATSSVTEPKIGAGAISPAKLKADVYGGNGSALTLAHSDHSHLFGYRSGAFVGPRVTGGGGTAQLNKAISTVSGQAICDIAPFYCPVDLVIDRVDVTVNTAAAAGNLRIGLYTVSAVGDPVTRVADLATLPATTTGLKTAILSPVVALGGNRWYVLVTYLDADGTVNISGYTSTQFLYGGGISVLNHLRTTPGMPTTWDGTYFSPGGITPNINMRVV